MQKMVTREAHCLKLAVRKLERIEFLENKISLKYVLLMVAQVAG